MSTVTHRTSQMLADHYDGPGWWPLIPLFWFALFITFFGRRRALRLVGPASLV